LGSEPGNLAGSSFPAIFSGPYVRAFYSNSIRAEKPETAYDFVLGE